MKPISTRNGAMLLITVIIVGSVALALGLHVSLRGVGELDMGFSSNQSLEALSIADACVQEALIRLSRDSGYIGGTLSVGDGSCVISVTSNGSERTIGVTATLSHWTRDLTVLVDLSTSPMTISDWKQNST